MKVWSAITQRVAYPPRDFGYSGHKDSYCLKIVKFYLPSFVFAAHIFVANIGEAKNTEKAFGWQELPNTNLQSVCPRNASFRFQYDFEHSCKFVTAAWSGGSFDSNRNRLYIWGGGHNDYYGNEVYALDLNKGKMHRLTDPAVPVAERGSKQSELPPFDGTQPNSRHTYDGIEYLPDVDLLWAFSGSLAGYGSSDNVTWFFSPDSNAWRHAQPIGDIPKGEYGIVSGYDPGGKVLYLHNRKGLYSYSYNPEGGVYKRLNEDGYLGLHTNGVVDPKRKKFIIIGNGHEHIYDLSSGSSFERKDLESMGDTTILKPQAPGLAYDPVLDRIVAWGGGDKVYFLDVDTRAWTSMSFKDGPGPQHGQGTYGRWVYVPALKAFVVYNDVRANAFLFRPPKNLIDQSAPSSPQNLTSIAQLSSKIQIRWDASADNIGVEGYRVFRDGNKLAELKGTRFAELGLKPDSEYHYSVQAFDSSGNISKESRIQVKTPAHTVKTPLGDCTQESRLSDRSDIIFCEPWEKEDWWADGYLMDPIIADPRKATSDRVSKTEITSDNCVSGKCLKVNMLKRKTGALSVYWPLINAKLAPEDLFLRYYIRLGPNWTPDMCDSDGKYVGGGGKFPGLGDPRTWADPGGQCGNGGARGDGINCWSMRSQYGKCVTGRTCLTKPDATTRFGSYLYYSGQHGSTGDPGYWDSEKYGQFTGDGGSCESVANNVFCGLGDQGHMVNDQWYQIEIQVKMNTPGVEDGIVRGWVDGVLSYEKTNIIFRLPNHDSLHNRLIWLNVFKGGMNGNCNDSAVYLDQMVLALDRPIGGFQSDTKAPPEIRFSASNRDVTAGSKVTLKWRSDRAESCVALGAWRDEQKLDGSYTSPALFESSTFGLRCNGDGGSVTKFTEITVRNSKTKQPIRKRPPPTALKKPKKSKAATKPNAYRIDAQSGKYKQAPGKIVSQPQKLKKIYLLEQDAEGISTYKILPDADTHLDPTTVQSLGSKEYLDVSVDRIILVRFDLNNFHGKRINKATLRFFDYGKYGSIDNAAVFRVDKEWSENTMGATSEYAIRNESSKWEGELGDWRDKNNVKHGNAPYATESLLDDDQAGWVKWDVTTLTNQWIQDVHPNYGFLLRNLKSKATHKFRSKEFSQDEQRPHLIIQVEEGR